MEAYEKMKRKAIFIDINAKENKDLIFKVPVEEINIDQT